MVEDIGSEPDDRGTEGVLSEIQIARNDANDSIRLPPADLKEWLSEDEFPDTSTAIADIDNIHLTREETLLIEDVTEYIPAAEIDTQAEPPILAIVDQDAESGEWRVTGPGRWHYGIVGPVAVFLFAFFVGVAAGSGTGLYTTAIQVAALTFLLGSLVVPLSLYMDIRNVRKTSDWRPRYWWYFGGLIFYGISIPVYLYRRWKVVGL